MNKEMPYYIRRPTLFFTNELVYPVSRSHNTKMRIAANSAKFYVYQQAPAASEQCLHSFTGKARLHPGGFNSIYFFESFDTSAQWRTEEGGFGVFKTPPRNSEAPPKLCQTQPDLRKLLKIAEFRTPRPKDVRKKGSKILKLPRFAIVLY